MIILQKIHNDVDFKVLVIHGICAGYITMYLSRERSHVAAITGPGSITMGNWLCSKTETIYHKVLVYVYLIPNFECIHS